jgi:light-regulated signal transduction histidine kinase (bacteriophytochrome)
VGTHENPFEKTDLNDILNLVKRDLSIAIAEASFTIHADNLPELVADQSKMKQLFQNLISNAIKFRSNENPKIEIKVKKEKKNWIFSFADNGIGINKQHFDRIFVIFQRLHTRDEYSGTGIGLAICKKIVERHQGKIWLESVMGSGTTFYFKLPIKVK